MNMKYHILILSLGLSITCSTVFGAVWRVNSTLGSEADFDFPQEAIDSLSVNDGDALLIEGAAAVYPDASLDRLLKLIGPGYFLSENLGLQANPLSAQVNNITVEPGAQGSLLIGIDVVQNVILNEGSVTVNRCRIGNILIVGSATASPNSIISQNYVNQIDINLASDTLLISNNYINNSIFSIFFNSTNVSGGHTVRNNVLGGVIDVYNSEVEENITTGATGSAGPTYFDNRGVVLRFNIGSGEEFGTANGNQSNVDMTTVFFDSESPDDRFQLFPAGPADGTGENGDDIGMFGGSEPYVISGIPPIPTITDIDVPAFGTIDDGLTIHLNGQAND